jgi:hypothetical protein
LTNPWLLRCAGSPFDEQDMLGSPAPINVRLVIGTAAATLSRAAFDIAPAKAVEHGQVSDAVMSTIVRARLTPYDQWANRGPATMRVWLPIATRGATAQGSSPGERC